MDVTGRADPAGLPCTSLVASHTQPGQSCGVTHEFPSSHQALLPTSCYRSPLAGALSTRYSRSSGTGFLRHSRAKALRLTSWHHGGVCALPLLTGNSAAAARKVIKVRTKNLPPQPSTTTHHALPPWEPSPTLAEGFTGRTILRKGAEACLSVLSAILHAQHSDQSSNPKQSTCPELRETEKESLFHVKQRTKPGTK